MPYYLTCPACGQRNHGHKEAPKGLSYFEDLACSQCGKASIYWVADPATAELLVDQRKVPRTSIAIGSGQSEILYTEPKVATGSPKKVAELLAPYASLEAVYSQGRRTDAFVSAIPALKHVKEGQCEGQSLDWIRRVLQGGASTYQVQAIKNGTARSDEQIMAKQQRQVKVGAAVQLSTSPEKLQPIVDKGMAKDKAAVDKQIEARLATLGITRSPTGWSIPHDKAAQWQQIKPKIEKIYAELGLKGHYEHAWEEVAQRLDGNKLHQKRPFSGVVATKSRGRSTYGGAADFARAVTEDPGFHAGSAALISVGLTVGRGEGGGSISGHAIALHYKSAGALFLFDPNIGVFLCRTLANLRQAVAVLISQGWVNVLGWSLDNEFGYSLFEPRASEQAVQRSETPVVASPSPGTTYLENRPVIPTPLTSAPTRSPAPTSSPSPSPTSPAPAPVVRTRVVAPSVSQGFRPQSPPQTLSPGTGRARGNVSELMKRFEPGGVKK